MRPAARCTGRITTKTTARARSNGPTWTAPRWKTSSPGWKVRLGWPWMKPRGKMYWRDYDEDNGTGKIQRANLDGSQVEDLVTGLKGSPLVLALDEARGKMYWTDYDEDNGTGKIQRSNLDGSQVEDLVTGLEGSLFGLALDEARGKIVLEGLRLGQLQGARSSGPTWTVPR